MRSLILIPKREIHDTSSNLPSGPSGPNLGTYEVDQSRIGSSLLFYFVMLSETLFIYSNNRIFRSSAPPQMANV